MKTNQSKNEILLAECFNSIQGEFPDVGTPYTFVRFKACNLHCPFCIKIEDDKNFVVYNTDTQEWFITNDIDSILSGNYPILAGLSEVAYLERIGQFEFDHYYKVHLKSTDGLKERIFLVSFDHFFATTYKESYRCTVTSFEYDNLANPSAISRYFWTPASLLDPEKLYVVGRNNTLYEILDVQLVNESITLQGLVTSTSTFVYGDVIHHNCDSAKVMKEGRVRLSLNEILEKVRQTNSILFTGGEPGLYLSQIATILDFIINALQENQLDAIYAIAAETNGYKINQLRELLQKRVEIISHLQKFKPAIRIAWSPKMYDDSSLQFSLSVLDQLDFTISPSESVFVKPVYDEQNLDRLEKFLDKLFEKFGNQARWNIALMPEGFTREKLLDKDYFHRLLKFAQKYKIGVSPRLHIIYDLA